MCSPTWTHIVLKIVNSTDISNLAPTSFVWFFFCILLIAQSIVGVIIGNSFGLDTFIPSGVVMPTLIFLVVPESPWHGRFLSLQDYYLADVLLASAPLLYCRISF